MKPLDENRLRTAGLASVNSAKFGMTRRKADGTPRAHQGIDYEIAHYNKKQHRRATDRKL